MLNINTIASLKGVASGDLEVRFVFTPQERKPMTRKSLTSLLALTVSLIALVSSISGCALSPEAKKKAREETLEKFSRDVTKHLLDRNPDTLKESVNQLMHGEVHTSALDKLQSRKILPDSTIDVLKAIDDAQIAHLSNEVQILNVRPLTPLEKDQVTFRVTGKEIFKVSGKQSAMRPFSLELICRLTPEMDNMPTLIDVGGMSASTAFSGSGTSTSSPKNKRSKSRRG
ncbi:hypothetical protein BH11CYA1_BH11CYA1_36670 [soil metagenome]